jgi:hypothetical protein
LLDQKEFGQDLGVQFIQRLGRVVENARTQLGVAQHVDGKVEQGDAQVRQLGLELRQLERKKLRNFLSIFPPTENRISAEYS